MKKTSFWLKLFVLLLVIWFQVQPVDASGDIETSSNTETSGNFETINIKEKVPKITYCKRYGKLGTKIKWKKIDGVEGYIIYVIKDYDDKSNYAIADPYDTKQYKVVKIIDDPDTNQIVLKGLMNGVTYTYRIRSYITVDEKRKKSSFSEPQSVLMDYYSYENEYYEQKIKRAFGSERKMQKYFTSDAKARKQMKNIKIRVWDFENGKNGKKITRIKYLTVNKRLAPSIVQMFEEIYKCDEKQVIKDIGCYSYRSGEHMYGMAIDINPNENYMIDGKTIICGKYWKPKKDPYSIPKKCETVRIMKRYGFYRGEWGDRKDYMHFSFFGT